MTRTVPLHRRRRARRSRLPRVKALAGTMLLMSGCTTFDGESIGARAPDVEVDTTAVAASGRYPWLEAPREYAQSIVDAEPATRLRARQEALAYLMRDPRAEAAVRLNLVYAAGVQNIEESHDAQAELQSALNQVRSTYVRAVLTEVAVTVDRLQQSLRREIETENLLNVENGRRKRAEDERDRLAARSAKLADDLLEAQEKLRALLSIEEQLQEGN